MSYVRQYYQVCYTRKIHLVLSTDKEIKEQFIGRWQLTRDRIEQKVTRAVHGVLSRDKEIKEQFLGRWQERAESVTCICMWSNREDYNVYMSIEDWTKPVKLLTPDVPNPEVLDDFLTMKKIEFYGINFS